MYAILLFKKIQIQTILGFIRRNSYMNGPRQHGTFTEILKESWENLKKSQKRVFTTLWSSKHAVCTTLLSCYSETMECSEKTTKDEDSTKETVTRGLV